MKAEFKKVLAIGAHFDDVEIGCAGTLVKFHEAGSEIKVIVVGDGDYRNYDGTSLRRSQDAVREGKNALKELGMSDDTLLNLEYPEKRIVFEEKLIEDLERVIDDYKPDLIITHWPHDSHQDHVAVSRAVISAARYYYSIWMWEPVFPSGRVITIPYVPQVYVDISSCNTVKDRALRTHKTQVDKFYSRGINWTEGIEARAKFRGFESGVNFAETFYVYRQKMG